MKQWKQKLLSLSLAATMLSGGVLSAHAALAPKYIGDTDGDDTVTVLDATRIQRWLVGIDGMDKLSQYLGDVDGDGECNILDATRIQRKLVGLDSFYRDQESDWYIEDWRLYPDYDSGKARVGTPVTFTAELPGYHDKIDPDIPSQAESPMYTFEFFIGPPTTNAKSENFICVRERDDYNRMTYTFTEPGVYTVLCRIYNHFDVIEDAYYSFYEVVYPYSLEDPVIVSAIFRDDTNYHMGNSPLYVRAEGGEGTYQYRYDIKTNRTADGWERVDDETITSGWIDQDSMSVPSEIFDADDIYPSCDIYVTVRDSKGNESETVHRIYVREDIPA